MISLLIPNKEQSTNSPRNAHDDGGFVVLVSSSLISSCSNTSSSSAPSSCSALLSNKQPSPHTLSSFFSFLLRTKSQSSPRRLLRISSSGDTPSSCCGTPDDLLEADKNEEEEENEKRRACEIILEQIGKVMFESAFFILDEDKVTTSSQINPHRVATTTRRKNKDDSGDTRKPNKRGSGDENASSSTAYDSSTTPRERRSCQQKPPEEMIEQRERRRREHQQDEKEERVSDYKEQQEEVQETKVPVIPRFETTTVTITKDCIELFSQDLLLPFLFLLCMHPHHESITKSLRPSYSSSSSANDNKSQQINTTSSALGDDDHDHADRITNFTFHLCSQLITPKSYLSNGFRSPTEMVAFILISVFMNSPFGDPNTDVLKMITARYPRSLLYTGNESQEEEGANGSSSGLVVNDGVLLENASTPFSSSHQHHAAESINDEDLLQEHRQQHQQHTMPQESKKPSCKQEEHKFPADHMMQQSRRLPLHLHSSSSTPPTIVFLLTKRPDEFFIDPSIRRSVSNNFLSFPTTHGANDSRTTNLTYQDVIKVPINLACHHCKDADLIFSMLKITYCCGGVEEQQQEPLIVGMDSSNHYKHDEEEDAIYEDDNKRSNKQEEENDDSHNFFCSRELNKSHHHFGEYHDVESSLLQLLIDDRNADNDQATTLPLTSKILDILLLRKDSPICAQVFTLLLRTKVVRIPLVGQVEAKSKLGHIFYSVNVLGSREGRDIHNDDGDGKMDWEEENDRSDERQQQRCNQYIASNKDHLKNTDLFHLFEVAATRGHTDTLRILLDLDPHIIMTKNYDTYYMPLQTAVMDFRFEPNKRNYIVKQEYADRIKFLLYEGIKYGIEYNVSTYLMGGLFAVESDDDTFLIEMIYLLEPERCWDMIRSCLGCFADTIEVVPILHAAIGKVHVEMLEDICKQVPWSAFSLDIEGNYAFHVALLKGLQWSRGLKYILHANPSAVKEIEANSGLLPLALAAMKEDISLETLYEISLCAVGEGHLKDFFV